MSSFLQVFYVVPSLVICLVVASVIGIGVSAVRLRALKQARHGGS